MPGDIVVGENFQASDPVLTPLAFDAVPGAGTKKSQLNIYFFLKLLEDLRFPDFSTDTNCPFPFHENRAMAEPNFQAGLLTLGSFY